jgi:dipeptidyl aminopeptidase/acylaminoacyl peptidase
MNQHARFTMIAIRSHFHTEEHNSVLFYRALQQAAVPAELHVYSQGGHGFGIRQRGEPISEWPDRWLQWMRGEGILPAHSR